MFNTGKGPLKLDGRCRLQVPSEAREGAVKVGEKAEFYAGVLPGIAHPSIWLMTRKQYDAFCKSLTSLGDTEEGRIARVAVVGSFATIETDQQGRATLPEKALEAAGITESVCLVGLEDRLEVWASDALEKLLESRKDRIGRTLEGFFARKLADARPNASGAAPSSSGEGKPTN